MSREQQDDFEPFLEKSFSSYLSEMSRIGTWGDELTLVLASPHTADPFSIMGSFDTTSRLGLHEDLHIA